MERCPNCRARYTEGVECRRCGMALSALLRLEAQAAAWERFAVERLLAGDLSGALAAAGESLARQHRPLAAMLRAFVRHRRARRRADDSGPPHPRPESGKGSN